MTVDAVVSHLPGENCILDTVMLLLFDIVLHIFMCFAFTNRNGTPLHTVYACYADYNLNH